MRKLIVTTEHRGVFFGDVEDESTAPEKLVIKNCRMCVYWDSANRGLLGLAADGPNASCRITKAVPEMTVWKVTSKIEVTPEAAEKWESAPWK